MTTSTAFKPAIEALLLDLAGFERQAEETRALIKQLRARAGVDRHKGAGIKAHVLGATLKAVARSYRLKTQRRNSPISERQGARNKTASGKLPEAAKGKTRDKAAKLLGVDQKTISNDVRKSSSKSEEKVLTGKAPATGSAATKAPAKPDRAAVEELKKIAGIIAEATAQAQSATHDKDAEKLTAAIEGRARAERRAGALLIAMAGKVRPLPGISKIEAKRWRRAAGLSEKDYEVRLQRAQRKAVAAIGKAVTSGGSKSEPPEVATQGPKQRSTTSPAPSPRPQMRLSEWARDDAGNLSRTLSAMT